MKVLVCLKQVPDTEANIKVTDNGKSISESGIKFIINPYDEFALEEALKLKDEGWAQTVSVISLGPSRTMEALRSALAMGADEALLLRCDSWLLDGLATARILAAEIAESGADLILTGKEAILEFEPRHPADILATWADIGKAERMLGWRPQVPFKDGVAQLVTWYGENREWARDVVTR